ncbi:MAG: ABC transporter permease subunit [Eubacteriales bacterium]|nr:ABC transporter permease subunit [Eubacteriales bacterium]
MVNSIKPQQMNGKYKWGIFSDIARNRFSYLLLLPAVAYVFIFSYCTYPYMIIAFKNFNYQLGVWGSEWCGTANFDFFLHSTNAMRVIRNTLVLNLLFILVGTAMSLFLAILLNELRSKTFVKTTQTFMLFPHYLSWVVVGYILLAIFSNKNGLANQIVTLFGGKSISWYTKPQYWTTILVMMKLWKDAGMNAVIYLAAITGIDESIYESATIDGANRFQRIIRITVPLIMPTVCIMTLLAVGKIMFGDFGMIYALVGDQGMLYETTDIIDTYVYRVLRQTGNPSQAMAIGLFQSLIGLIMVLGSNRIVKRTFSEGALF